MQTVATPARQVKPLPIPPTAPYWRTGVIVEVGVIDPATATEHVISVDVPLMVEEADPGTGSPRTWQIDGDPSVCRIEPPPRSMLHAAQLGLLVDSSIDDLTAKYIENHPEALDRPEPDI